MANGEITLPVGVDASFQVALLDQNGNPITTYTSSDTPFCEVWAGLDQPIILTPTAVWISAPAGTIQLTFVASLTQSVSPGKYRLRVGVLTAGGNRNVIPDTFVEFTSSPGSASTLTNYCAYADMLVYASWIGEMQDVVDETGFAKQRNLARQWLERIIQRHNYGSFWNEFATPLFGFQIGGNDTLRNWGQTDPILQGWLDSDYLRINEQVVEITAKYALSLVCLAQIGSSDKKTEWQQMGNDFYADAQRLVVAYSAEIYLPGNTIAPIKVIPCGRITMR